MLRLFYALPCPAHIATRVDTWRQGQQFAGQPVPAGNLHLTLAFLGHLPESRLALLEQLPARLPLAELAFELRLDRLDCWHGGLLHLAPSQPPEQLLALADGLQQLLAEAGMPIENRDYKPHLTLARESHLPERVAAPAYAWNVDEFVLYQSEKGLYHPLKRWPLA